MRRRIRAYGRPRATQSSDRIGRAPYLGAAGRKERYFLAVVNLQNEVLQRMSRDFDTLGEALAALMRRRDRDTRLVRDLTFRDIVE